MDLRQSTASQEIPLGPFLDDTDGKTAETGLTIANTDIKIWKSGATSRVNKNALGATHMDGGVYYCTLDATDTDTIGPMVIFVHVAGALPVRLECNVLHANVYDVKYGTVAPSTFAGGAVASVTGNVGGNVVGSVGSVTGFNVNGSGLTAVPWNAAWDAEVQSEVQDAIEVNNLDHLLKIAVDTNFGTTVHADSVIGYLATTVASTNYDRTTDSLEAIRNRVDVLYSAIADTDTHVLANTTWLTDYIIPSLGSIEAWDGSNLTAIPWNAAWDAEVRDTVGLAAADLDVQLAAIGGSVGDVKFVTDKLDTAMEVDGLVYRFTTNALEQAPSGGGGGTDWTADERSAIRTILGIPASGTTPEEPSAGALKIIDDFLDTEIAAIKAKTDALTITSGNVSAVLANAAHGGVASTLTLERMVVASTTTNEPAIKLTGNGSGAGMLSTGGATGHGLSVAGGATAGDGLRCVATTNGAGITITANGSGRAGVNITGAGGSSFGAGIYISVANGSAAGINCSGNGSHGALFSGGATSAGIRLSGMHGLQAFSASNNGNGIYASGDGFGAGIRVQGGTTAAGDGILVTAGAGGVDIRANMTGNITGTITTTTNLTNLPAIPADWLTASGLAADAIAEIQAGLSTLDIGDLPVPPTPAEIADGLLDRSIVGGVDGGRDVRSALRAARNRVVFDAPAVGQFTVYEEDDTTPAWTGTYSRGSLSQGPLVETNPAS